MVSDRFAKADQAPSAESGWPKVSWTEHDWVSKIPAEMVSARMRERSSGPYRAAVVPFIADRSPQIPADIAATAEDASLEIARFDTEIGAEIAPFASVLLRSESAASSMIENLTSGAKAIALAELGSTELCSPEKRGNAIEIVGNVEAMKAALELANRLDQDAILAMHAALMAKHDPDTAGRWRKEQVWIGGHSLGPHGALFVPPYHNDVPKLIDDLVRFTRRTDLPLLCQAAIAHAQFETIHPFTEGNGRTGRALVHAILRGHGLTRNVTVPVSAGLLHDTRSYFDALGAYRDGDPAAIVEKLAQASFAATVNGRRLVVELRTIRASWNDKIHARRGSGALRLADVLVRQPVVDAATVAAELGITAQNAQRAIAPLTEAGILVEFTGFARNRMWQCREVLNALDDFAARAGRRGGL